MPRKSKATESGKPLSKRLCPYECPFEDRMLKHEDLMNWSGRLESGINKFAEATQQLAVNLAGTTKRLDAVEDAMQHSSTARQTEIDAIRESQAQDYRYLDGRIATVQTELTNRIEQQTKDLTEHLDQGFEKIAAKIEAEKTERKEDTKVLASRVTSLELWRGLIIGGAIVIGFILSAFVLRIAWIMIENNGAQWFPFIK